MTVLVVIAFNLIMLILLELPLLGYLGPRTGLRGAVGRAKAYVGRNGRRVAIVVLTTLGAALVTKGIIGLAT